MKKIYTPVDLCPIGVNKGEKLYLVYKYAPDYLQWLISKEIIKVDISEFSKLPNPTPIQLIFLKKLDELTLSIKVKNRVRSSLAIAKPLSEKEIEAVAYKALNPNNLDINNSVKYALKFIKTFKIKPPSINFNFSRNIIDINNKPYTANVISNLRIEREDYDFGYDDYKESYTKYGGYNDYSDDAIDSAFDGNPEATWNVD